MLKFSGFADLTSCLGEVLEILHAEALSNDPATTRISNAW